MLYYIKKYLVSLAIILTVIYLSFLKPPTTELGTIPNLDKMVHIYMYFGMSGILWLESLRTHRKDHTPIWRAQVGTFICPVLFSRIMELLQEYYTTCRGGGRLGFVTDTTGAVLTSLATCLVLKP